MQTEQSMKRIIVSLFVLLALGISILPVSNSGAFAQGTNPKQNDGG